MKLRVSLICLCFSMGAGAASFAFGCDPGPSNIERRQTFYSPVLRVDKIYKSMQGPIGSIAFDLNSPTPDASPAPELVWLTGFRSIVVDEERKQLPQHFMCHTNLVYRGLGAHREVFRGASLVNKDKLFTISQGEEEARFPDGFGIPVVSNLRGASFGVFNQLLNVNHKDFRDPLRLQYENTIFYVPESERRRDIRPLYQALGQVMVAVNQDNAIFDMPAPGDLHAQASCSGGDTASPMTFKDRFGQEFSYHWRLPPGREVRRTLITRTMLKLKYDTTIHHIVAHMHPFGESLALKDLTTGEVLFQSNMTSYSDRIGVAKVEHYSSAEGIPVYTDHEYALISTYNNTSRETHDAMAIMYFFLYDKEFRPPDADALTRARNWQPPPDQHRAMGHM
ncbi:MAG: hypothetical protein RIF32_12930 [Leptospirales bacterium]|jgi:hypothetical protein